MKLADLSIRLVSPLGISFEGNSPKHLDPRLIKSKREYSKAYYRANKEKILSRQRTSPFVCQRCGVAVVEQRKGGWKHASGGSTSRKSCGLTPIPVKREDPRG